MKFASLILISLTCLGCAVDSGPIASPTAPTAPTAPGPTIPKPTTPNPVAFLSGMVISTGGGCINGATVEIVGGQGIGRSMTQTIPCSWWDWDDGFEFRELIPGVELTLRASAPGYAPKEGTFLPSLVKDGSGRYQAVLELARIQSSIR